MVIAILRTVLTMVGVLFIKNAGILRLAPTQKRLGNGLNQLARLKLSPPPPTPTKDKTMTFDKWYAQQNPDLDPRLDDAVNELRSAYDAGASTKDKTLRDEFAGQALQGCMIISMEYLECAYPSGTIVADARALEAYKMADAMLEARKTTGEDKT
jgi:hypothetical protein